MYTVPGRSVACNHETKHCIQVSRLNVELDRKSRSHSGSGKVSEASSRRGLRYRKIQAADDIANFKNLPFFRKYGDLVSSQFKCIM